MDSPPPSLICPHLVELATRFQAWFTGRDMESHWICDACAKAFPTPPELVPIPSGDFLQRLKGQRPRDPHGFVGKPGIRQREAGLRMNSERFPFPFEESLVTPWLDIQPDLTTQGQWFLLLRSGAIATFHPREQRLRILFRLDPGFIPDDETALHVDATGGYGAVCQCDASLAWVFDLRSGAVTKQINRGDYYPEHCRFPLAFFTDPSGRPLLAAATAWNILEIIDPSDGNILTSRAFEKGDAESERTALDYFHSTLSVSPGNRWIADYGWFWHPIGGVRTWNLLDWLERNPWESETGPSVGSTADRTYFWDGPMCWVDDTTLAVWGWGDDDLQLLSAVGFYDVASREELRWFPGPEARRTDSNERKHLPPSLFFDGYLFSAHDEHGLAVWDIADGARLLHQPSLTPQHYHPGSKEFISISGETVTLSRLTK